MSLFACGLSHKTAPVGVREKLALSPERQIEALAGIAALPGLREALLLSTCNRFEIYGACDRSHDQSAVVGFLASFVSMDPGVIAPHIYLYDEPETILHAMRVASSLDSQIVGESQILGQVKDAYRRAHEAGTAGKLVGRLLQRSLEVGKRVRTQTEISKIPISVSHAAVELGRRIFGNLEDRSVLVVGVGEMSETTLKHLVSNGVRKILVSNRTMVRACSLASLHGGRAVPFEELDRALEEPDIVITSTAASEPIITDAMVRKAMVARKRRPLFLVDIAVPRDVEAAVGRQEDVYLYDIDDLKGMADRNQHSRMIEAVKAEELVREAQQEFLRWRRSQESVPLIQLLERRVESLVDEEYRKLTWKLDRLGDRERKVVQQSLRALARKIGHMPIAAVKRLSEEDGSQYTLGLLEETFRELAGAGSERGDDGPADVLPLEKREVTKT